MVSKSGSGGRRRGRRRHPPGRAGPPPGPTQTAGRAGAAGTAGRAGDRRTGPGTGPDPNLRWDKKKEHFFVGLATMTGKKKDTLPFKQKRVTSHHTPIR